MKYYNHCLFYLIQPGFIIQSGDPTGTGKGGSSIFGVINGEKERFFEDDFSPKLKHNKTGIVSMNNFGSNTNNSQFFITLRKDDLQFLDKKYMIVGEIVEGLDVVINISDAFCDQEGRPLRNIRILKTNILFDPFPDPNGFQEPDASPNREIAYQSNDVRFEKDEKIEENNTDEQIKMQDAKVKADILTMVGDIPDPEIKPPDNVLFVCKLNPITEKDDLEVIFSRFGKINSCDIVRNRKTGDSLCYGFIEFENKESCEQAYLKMDKALIDDRHIHVDFCQSIAKVDPRKKQKTSESTNMALTRRKHLHQEKKKKDSIKVKDSSFNPDVANLLFGGLGDQIKSYLENQEKEKEKKRKKRERGGRGKRKGEEKKKGKEKEEQKEKKKRKIEKEEKRREKKKEKRKVRKKKE
eukprot:Anaeramoba_ignava/a93209_8.p1 GENE.a93209_8~~a93209_8.p1  ORF type:complete len:428 (+),score=165.03 a93209_8:57-1286(+)